MPTLAVLVIYHEGHRWTVRRTIILTEGGKTKVVPDEDPWFVGDSLASARRSIPRRHKRIRRSPLDEPQIREAWLVAEDRLEQRPWFAMLFRPRIIRTER
jgi:hypothetical protein